MGPVFLMIVNTSQSSYKVSDVAPAPGFQCGEIPALADLLCSYEGKMDDVMKLMANFLEVVRIQGAETYPKVIWALVPMCPR